jgi:hypothetical protein
MAKKDFKDNLRRRNLATLIPTKEAENTTDTMEAVEEEVVQETIVKEKKPRATKKKVAKPKKPKLRPVTFRLPEDLIFDTKAMAFWDRRDFTEMVTKAIQYYMDSFPEAELKKARREYTKRLEEE